MPMMNQDERFSAKLSSWFKNSLAIVMYEASLAEIKPIGFNDYWGHCNTSSISTNWEGMWPISIEVRIDEFRNEKHHWQRKSQ